MFVCPIMVQPSVYVCICMYVLHVLVKNHSLKQMNHELHGLPHFCSRNCNILAMLWIRNNFFDVLYNQLAVKTMTIHHSKYIPRGRRHGKLNFESLALFETWRLRILNVNSHHIVLHCFPLNILILFKYSFLIYF